MPHSRTACRFHMLRAHLEVNTCKNLRQRLEEDHGFKRNIDGQLVPVMTD